MLMQVHDELVFEVREDAVEAVRAGVIERMSGAAELAVPLLVEVGRGRQLGRSALTTCSMFARRPSVRCDAGDREVFDFCHMNRR